MIMHSIQVMNPEGAFPSSKSLTAAITSTKAEKEVEPGNVLSTRGGSVAARLRSLGTNDPLNKGHPRSIEKEIELCQTYFRN